MARGVSDVQEDWEVLIHRAEPPDKLRFGVPPFTYAAPLSAPLRGRDDVTVTDAMPDALLRDLREGVLDCALLPLLDCLQLTRGRVIPGVGVCSRGKSNMAYLIVRGSVDSIKRIAYDVHASGAVAIARVVMAERSGETTEFVACDELKPLEEDMDGALITGGRPEAWVDPDAARLDLSEAWNEQSGLPLVHALWLGRPGAAYPRLRQIIGLAARHIEVEDAEKSGAYYSVGSEEMNGMRAFFEFAARQGLCEADARIRLC